jgi:hypothetical protein
LGGNYFFKKVFFINTYVDSTLLIILEDSKFIKDYKEKLSPWNEYWTKKLPIWLPTTKSQESTRFPYVQAMCNIPFERSWQGLQLYFRPRCNRRSHKKLRALKVMRVRIVGISRFPFGSLGTKSHLDVAPMERRRVYNKGEGGGFPQVWAVVNLVCPSCPWLVLAPKMFQLCTNHFVLVCACPCEWVKLVTSS